MTGKLSTTRNFCVVSHINHGKTTLTDRFLESCGVDAGGKLKERLLDSNPIEQEKGITIKLAPVSLTYHLGAEIYNLNLIDTPGHVDFSYEVSRSLAACEGALLLVDATQGIQAQTLAPAQKALVQGLKLIPVVNKIDLDNARIDQTSQELQDVFGFNAAEIVAVSAKTGQNLVQLIKAVIDRLPSPQGDPEKPLKALVFNSFYHPHLGVIAAVRLVDGRLNLKDKLLLFAAGKIFSPQQIGFFIPAMKPTVTLTAGQVGYIATGLKDIYLCRVGDTVTGYPAAPDFKPLPGYQEPQPMVFMDIFPHDNSDFVKLKSALEKLSLVDASLKLAPTASPLLGSGFQIGFQGLLHADITKERLEREFDLSLLFTNPAITYKVVLKKDRQEVEILNPADLPDPSLIDTVKEPFVKITIFTPSQYLGHVTLLTQTRRGVLIDQNHFGSLVKLSYHLPLAELIKNFFSQLKSTSSGYASLDWQFLDYRPADIVKLTTLISGQEINPLALLLPRDQAQTQAQALAKKLKSVIPRHQFEVPIQVALGGKILARETVKAVRKDVTAKLYGGDQTRKDKLLSKQKKGKKKLKRLGRVELPQEAFLAALDTH